MLVIQDTSERTRMIAHLHADTIPLLKHIKEKLNGEAWLYDCKGMEVVQFARLDLDTAKEADTA